MLLADTCIVSPRERKGRLSCDKSATATVGWPETLSEGFKNSFLLYLFFTLFLSVDPPPTYLMENSTNLLRRNFWTLPLPSGPGWAMSRIAQRPAVTCPFDRRQVLSRGTTQVSPCLKFTIYHNKYYLRCRRSCPQYTCGFLCKWLLTTHLVGSRE